MIVWNLYGANLYDNVHVPKQNINSYACPDDTIITLSYNYSDPVSYSRFIVIYDDPLHLPTCI